MPDRRSRSCGSSPGDSGSRRGTGTCGASTRRPVPRRWSRRWRPWASPVAETGDVAAARGGVRRRGGSRSHRSCRRVGSRAVAGAAGVAGGAPAGDDRGDRAARIGGGAHHPARGRRTRRGRRARRRPRGVGRPARRRAPAPRRAARPLACGLPRAAGRDGARPALSADVLVAPDRVAVLGPPRAPVGRARPGVRPAPAARAWARTWATSTPWREAIGGLGGQIVGTLPLLATYLDDAVSTRARTRRSAGGSGTSCSSTSPALPELTSRRRRGRQPGGSALVRPRRQRPGPAASTTATSTATCAACWSTSWPPADDWPAPLRGAYADLARRASRCRRLRPVPGRSARPRAPAGTRGPSRSASGKIGDGDVDDDAVAVHAFGQYALARDLAGVDRRLAARGQRLYLDLPVGASGGRLRHLEGSAVFAWGAAAGAPPDDFFSEGQDWGFPPLRPFVPGNAHLRHFRAVLRHHMTVARHAPPRPRHEPRAPVLGARRHRTPARACTCATPARPCWPCWPSSRPRTGCVVVGEDLGTVTDPGRAPPWPSAACSGCTSPSSASRAGTAPRWGRPGPASWRRSTPTTRPRSPAGCTASTSTSATLLGLLDDAGADAARAERRAQVRNLLAFLVHRGRRRAGHPRGGRRGAARRAAALPGRQRRRRRAGGAWTTSSASGTPRTSRARRSDRPNWVQRVRISAAELVDGPGDREAAGDVAGMPPGLARARRGRGDGRSVVRVSDRINGAPGQENGAVWVGGRGCQPSIIRAGRRSRR